MSLLAVSCTLVKPTLCAYIVAQTLVIMDLASSIDFDTLNVDNSNRPPVSIKGHGIDVNRQFDIYTNDPVLDPIEAPPIYQKKQSPDASAPYTRRTAQMYQLFDLPNPPKFVLKASPHIPTPPRTAGEDHARQLNEVRQSLQLSRPVHSQEIENFPRPGPIDEPHSKPKHPGKDAIICELSVVVHPHCLFTWLTAVRTGTSMDFTQPDETMPGRMGMAHGASTCTIQITTKRKGTAGGASRTLRRIWVIANDGKVCIQHKRMLTVHLQLRLMVDIVQYLKRPTPFLTPYGATKTKSSSLIQPNYASTRLPNPRPHIGQ